MKSALEEALEMAKFAKAKGIDLREIYSKEEIQKFLDISERTFWRMIKDRRLKYVRVKGSKKVEVLGEWVIEAYTDRNLVSK